MVSILSNVLIDLLDAKHNDEDNSVMDEIRRRVKSDKIDKTVNTEKQNRHIRGTREYVEGRSYLFDDVNPQELVDKYHGTGFMPINGRGEWKSVETVSTEEDIGVEVNPDTMTKTPTNRFTIHYSKTGTHVVPSERRT